MNIRFFTTAIVFLLFCSIASAQTDSIPHPWHHEMIAGLNFNQINFTHWAQGGTNALSYVAGVNGKSVRDGVSTNWATTYKLDYGQTKLDGSEIRKTDDEINIESMVTFKWGVKVDPYVAASLLTQFGPGYNYTDTAPPVQISNFFDPGYLKQSAGVGWLVTNGFDTRLGVALREIVTNHYNQYAAEPLESEVKKVRVEGGLESVTGVSLPIDSNVLFLAKLDLFSPFNTMDRIVVHGETSVVAKISKLFSTQLSAFFINEPDISPYTQIKEGLAIGITYSIL